MPYTETELLFGVGAPDALERSHGPGSLALLGGLGSFGGRRLAFGGFVELALLALDYLLNPLTEFAVVHDSKIDRLLG